ncbi:hypothetical protein SAMN05720467_1086 [Fibrobacter sp. UWB7]|nr:hypothetical protein SAMN05720467_1086 [Fibrobacter sp. UWB7]
MATPSFYFLNFDVVFWLEIRIDFKDCSESTIKNCEDISLHFKPKT